MNNNLEKIRIIEANRLDSKNYFQSLLDQAYTKELLNDRDMERLQYECLNLLAYKTERFNSGDSSSIRVEKAQDIMTSIFFTIGLWLKTYPNPDDAVTALQNEPIKGIYEKGRKRIDTLISTTKIIHAKLLSQLIETPNVFYRSTLEDGIKGFFKLYYPDFSAQEIHITADYPLFNPIQKLEGIEFIKAYIEAAYHENQFCRNFSADDIHHLLNGYVEDYQEHLINLYEPVLLAALGCIIAGTDVYQLNISESGATYLYQLFTDKPKSEIAALIQIAARELFNIMDCPQGLILYIQNSLPLIVLKIETAMLEQTLDRVFVLPVYPEDRPKILLSFGEKMDNEQYRKIIEEIRQCRFIEDKVAIIKESIHSLADLEDMLLDTDLTGKEVKAILGELSIPELAAFSKKYLPMSEIEPFELREQEQRLRCQLHDFITALPNTQQNVITETSKVIQEK